MAAYDNVSLAGPPNIATAGNYAQLLMQGLQQLGKDYQSGQEFNYQQQQRNLFQNGIPTNAQGQPDFYGMLQKMIQAGGSPVAGQVLPMLQKQPFMDAALKEYQNDSGQPVNTSPAAASSASGPANITGQSPSRQPTQVSETQGGDRINNLAADRGIDLDQFLGKYPGFRSLLNQDLTPGQAKAVAQRMDAMRGGGASANPVPQAGLAGDDNNTNQQTPTGSMGGGGPISPAPTAASGNIGGAPSGGRQPLQVTVPIGGSRPASFDDRFAGGAPVTGGAAGMVPPGTDPRSYAEALKKRADFLRRQGDLRGFIGTPSKAKEDQAAALDKQADAILEQLGKAGELTPEQKNVASGAEERKGQIAADTKYYDSLHRGLAGSAMIAAQQKQNVDILRQVAASPSFAPGSGSDLWLAYQRMAAQLGINPTGAAPREVFNQISARILADQFSGLRSMAAETGEQGARIFKSMLDIEEKANIVPEDSLEGIKAKLDLIDKTGDLMMKWGDKADDYKLKHGRLDAGFDKELRADIAKARVQNAVPKSAAGAPPVGHIEQGYRFKGGNHRDPKNWEPMS